MSTTTIRATLKWDVLVTNKGITRDLPPDKEVAALVEWIARAAEPDHDLCHSRPWRPFFWLDWHKRFMRCTSARKAGMWRPRFAVRFRRTVGSTTFAYLTDWRIGLAQMLLKN
jgi:hypothetical protein